MRALSIWRYFSCIVLVGLLFFACKKENKSAKDSKEPTKNKVSISDGMYYNTVQNLDKALTNFKRFLGTNRGLEIYANIDHQENARKVEMALAENQVFFFDNPRFSAPLIQENPLLGLEFPTRVAFCKKGENALVFSRSTAWFKQRYGLKFSPAFQSYSNLTKAFIKQASRADVVEEEAITLSKHQGIEMVKSKLGFKETVEGISQVLDQNEKIFKILSFNFQEKAKVTNYKLEPLHLFIFGNPEIGTQLMQKSPNFSIDLPLKILVRETSDGEVMLYYNDMNFLADIHQTKFKDNLPEKLNLIIQKIISDGVSSN